MIRGEIAILTLALLGSTAHAQEAAPTGCLKLVRPAPYGSILSRSSVEPADCAAHPVAGAVRLDSAAGLARAARNLAAGDIIPALPAFTLADIDRGQALVIVSRSGPVVVRRTVKAVQASRPGRSLFVQDAQGQVFAIPYPQAAP